MSAVTSSPADQEGAAPASGASRPARLELVRRAGITVPFILLFIVLSVTSSAFFTKTNLLNLLDQQSATLIIAAAGTLVIVAGGLDLSVGAVYALSGVVAGQLALHGSVVAAMVAALVVGLGVGLVNGILTTVLRINALIATLAMSFVVAGAAGLVTSGNIIVLNSKPAFGRLAQSHFLTVTTSTWIAVFAVVMLAILLSRSTLGRYTYASGGNAGAARLAGVKVNQVKVVTYMLSGAAAAVGGLIDTSRVLSAQSSSGGDALTFAVIAGIVVRGTSILGGEGAVWRTVLGVLFIALVSNGYNLIGLNALYEQITLGLIILVAVGIDALSHFRSSSS